MDDCLVRATTGTCTPTPLAEALGRGPWLVVAPHDDDALLGMGATIAAATAAGIAVHVAVVSDGRMGWDDPGQRSNIVSIRKKEMRASLAALGVPEDRLHELGFADASLHLAAGARPEEQGSGIGRTLTRILRQVKPGTVFCCTERDLHPDHQVVANETPMAVCWASSPIWRELGAPIAEPRQWSYAVYCDFANQPTVQMRAGQRTFAAKIAGLRQFASQPFIDAMVERLEADGPVEFLAPCQAPIYRPATYASLFATPGVGDGQRAFADDCTLTLAALDAWRPWPALDNAFAPGSKPLLLVGEGSSRLFPAAFARHLLRRRGPAAPFDCCGGRAAQGADLAGRRRLWVSNSGATRELVEAARTLDTAGDLCLTGLPGGPLPALVAERRHVLPRAETAVAATASVLMQALSVGAAAAGTPPPLAAIRAGVAAVLAAPLPPAAIAALAGAERLWWADPETGVADELALKTMELSGQIGVSAPGTMLLHGIEEVLGASDCLVWFSPDARDAALRERAMATTGSRLLVVDALLPIADCGPWTPLLWLVAGWRLLAAAAAQRGRDPARPRRARKVGNPLPDAGPR